MEQTVQSLQRSYMQLLSSAASVLEAKEAEDQEGVGERENGRGRVRGRATTARADMALESFLQNWQLFHVACDEAQEFVESVRQRIGLECLVDEATGSLSHSHSGASSGAANTTTTTTSKAASDGTNVRKPGLPPLSAVRLEQMSKAVRWLVLELQQSSSNNNSINNASGLISTTAPPPPPPPLQGSALAFGSLSAMASTMVAAASTSSIGTTTTTEARPLSATPSSASEDGGAQ